MSFAINFDGVQIQDEEQTTHIRYDRFERKMVQCMKTQEYGPDSEEVLLSAFRALDEENKGYVEVDYLEELLCKMGTPFRNKEIEAFLTVSKDLQTGRVYYQDYVCLLARQIQEHRRESNQF